MQIERVLHLCDKKGEQGDHGRRRTWMAGEADGGGGVKKQKRNSPASEHLVERGHEMEVCNEEQTSYKVSFIYFY